MIEVIFLCVLTILFLVFASIHDIREKLVSNWLVLALVLFALGFRFFYSLTSSDFTFLYQGLLGFGIFFVVGNLFYFSRIFGFGDAKLLIALGPILPFFSTFAMNLRVLFVFLFAFLILGEVYSLTIVFIVSLRNRKRFFKTFSHMFKKHETMVLSFALFGFLLVVLGFFLRISFYFVPFISLLGIFCFLVPVLYIFLKSVEHVSFVKKVPYSRLVEGDVLYHGVVAGGKKIQASSLGLNTEEIRLLTKYKKSVYLRQGIPFVPVFLLTFLFTLGFFFLWNPFW